MTPGTTNISHHDTFRRAARLVLALAALVLLVPLVAGAQSQAETRVLNYIRDNLKPGQPVQVSDLYRKVFT
jgi:hypothetical protein